MKPKLKIIVLCSMQKALLFLFVISILAACGPANDDDNYTPKPQGYYKIELPKKEYQKYSAACPFTFEYSTSALISIDSAYKAEPCWINVDYPTLRARIYLSYKPVNTNNLNALLEDTRSMVYKHTVKADDIKERFYGNPDKKVFGNMYEIGGNAASSVQFYVTDSTQHFLRGALYFYAPPNADSLAPVISYVKQDIAHLMETVEWR
jgi:gliding motility-associated lipoprotein GldD